MAMYRVQIEKDMTGSTGLTVGRWKLSVFWCTGTSHDCFFLHSAFDEWFHNHLSDTGK